MTAGSSWRGEDGSVALELALVAPLLVLLLVGVLGTLGLVVDQLRVTQAARSAARTYAVTGERAAAIAAAHHAAPSATVLLDRSRHGVQVQVRLADALLGIGYVVDARAAAPLEPGAR